MENIDELDIQSKRILTMLIPLYKTKSGYAVVGDSLELMKCIDTNSVQLVITSPPFALQRQKEYGNKEQHEYVDWLLQFTPEIKRILKDNGSFVIDLGGAYLKGKPIRSIYNFRILVNMCDKHGWNLAEEFYWYNPAKLPGPIEWVNKRKIRVKDAVNTVWWFSKTDYPKADVRKVLVPYSERMKLLMKNKETYYKPAKRPSGHDISSGFGNNNSGAIPSNMLSIPNTESNSQYLRYCKQTGIQGHPARFPSKLPEFFINFLTDEGDTVLDIFAGSNTTGWVAEKLNRKWISFEIQHKYLCDSVFRFLPEVKSEELQTLYKYLLSNDKLNLDLENYINKIVKSNSQIKLNWG